MSVFVRSFFHGLSRSQISHSNARLGKQPFKNKQKRLICCSESPFWSLSLAEAMLALFERYFFRKEELGGVNKSLEVPWAW